MAEDYGYNDVEAVAEETKKNSNKYLTFEKGKSQTFTIRIASRPKYVIRHWADNKPLVHEPGTEKDDKGNLINKCQYCGDQIPQKDRFDKVAQWAWIVIDREDEGVKIFKAPNGVALRIKELSGLISKKTEKPIWGDPQNWDVIITRNYENGRYSYEIDGDVESREPMTDEEKKAVVEAGYDLSKELQGGKESNHVGNYSATPDMETAPDTETVDPKDIPDNLGKEDGDTEEVSDEDIPF